MNSINIITEMITPMDSIPPRSVHNDSMQLDEENTLLIIRDVLDEEQLYSRCM